MNILVSIKLPRHVNALPHSSDRYDTYHALNDGVSVGAGGELMLVSERAGNVPIEFHIYAAGGWVEATGQRVE